MKSYFNLGCNSLLCLMSDVYSLWNHFYGKQFNMKPLAFSVQPLKLSYIMTLVELPPPWSCNVPQNISSSFTSPRNASVLGYISGTCHWMTQYTQLFAWIRECESVTSKETDGDLRSHRSFANFPTRENSCRDGDCALLLYELTVIAAYSWTRWDGEILQSTSLMGKENELPNTDLNGVEFPTSHEQNWTSLWLWVAREG